MDNSNNHLTSHSRDDAITFDQESHSYYVHGEKMSISVTGLVHQYFPSFNSDRIVKAMLNSKRFPLEPKHQRYHTLPIWCKVNDNETANIDAWEPGAVLRNQKDAEKIIKESWSKGNTKASTEGTDLHQEIEDYIKLGQLPNEMSVEFQYFLDYHQQMLERGYKPYQSEQMVYDVSLQLAGCVDMMYTRDGKIYLTDWKRSKEILWDKTFRGKTETGMGPMSNYPNCNGIHYSLQLNIYRELLERYYGVEVSEMSIVVFHPTNQKYLEYPIQDLRKEVNEIFELRRQKLQPK
ncbi:Hypothetical protein POVR1_LOCUS341 [uncultured virus]|nr:Hypothetical protein POVR1_LOCUS341 [uncultured virus]